MTDFSGDNIIFNLLERILAREESIQKHLLIIESEIASQRHDMQALRGRLAEVETKLGAFQPPIDRCHQRTDQGPKSNQGATDQDVIPDCGDANAG